MKRSVKRTPEGQWRAYGAFGECLKRRHCHCATFDTWVAAMSHASRIDNEADEGSSA